MPKHKPLVPPPEAINELMSAIFNEENREPITSLVQKIGIICDGEKSSVVVAAMTEILLRSIMALTPPELSQLGSRAALTALFIGLMDLMNEHLFDDPER